jgi:hypothetical protein
MKVVWGAESYFQLARYAHLANVNQQTAMSDPKDYYSPTSRLATMMMNGHQDVKLSRQELQSIIRWLDTNCVNYGDWSWNKNELRTFNVEGVDALRSEISSQFGPELAAQPVEALVNLADLEQSRILKAGLAEEAGGWAGSNPQWTSTDDAGFQSMKAAVTAAINPLEYHDVADTCGRGTDNGCLCGSCWVREYYSGNLQVLDKTNVKKPLYPDLRRISPGLLNGRFQSEMYK